MRTPVDPRASGEDLTAKARIRNAAMDLYAEHGEDRTSMRAIAAAAGVTVGLLVHHFGTKDGLRDAVEQLVVDYFAQVIAQVPVTGTAAEIGAARDAAVQEMLAANPAVVNYLRRAVLDPTRREGRLLERLTELARKEVTQLRATGYASATRSESSQVISVMVRQLGHLFLQPMIDAMWRQLAEPGAADADKPILEVRARSSSRASGQAVS
jgi:TetR/AcrR family transcriptional regulator, regulator of cefoperazone and chloramphenicol sensitivity